MMNNKVTSEAFSKVFEIVRRREPRLLEFEFFLTKYGLSDDQREEIREILADEFAEFGLKPDSEPNQYGLLIESLIDSLENA